MVHVYGKYNVKSTSTRNARKRLSDTEKYRRRVSKNKFSCKKGTYSYDTCKVIKKYIDITIKARDSFDNYHLLEDNFPFAFRQSGVIVESVVSTGSDSPFKEVLPSYGYICNDLQDEIYRNIHNLKFLPVKEEILNPYQLLYRRKEMKPFHSIEMSRFLCLNDWPEKAVSKFYTIFNLFNIVMEDLVHTVFLKQVNLSNQVYLRSCIDEEIYQDWSDSDSDLNSEEDESSPRIYIPDELQDIIYKRIHEIKFIAVKRGLINPQNHLNLNHFHLMDTNSIAVIIHSYIVCNDWTCDNLNQLQHHIITFEIYNRDHHLLAHTVAARARIRLERSVPYTCTMQSGVEIITPEFTTEGVDEIIRTLNGIDIAQSDNNTQRIGKRKKKRNKERDAFNKRIRKRLNRLDLKLKKLQNNKDERIDRYWRQGGILSALGGEKLGGDLERTVDNLEKITSEGITHNISCKQMLGEVTTFINSEQIPLRVLQLLSVLLHSYDIAYMYNNEGDQSRTVIVITGLLDAFMALYYATSFQHQAFLAVLVCINTVRMTAPHVYTAVGVRTTVNTDYDKTNVSQGVKDFWSPQVLEVDPPVTVTRNSGSDKWVLDFTLDNPIIAKLVTALTGLMYVLTFAVPAKGDILNTIFSRLKNAMTISSNLGAFTGFIGDVVSWITSFFVNPDEANFIIKLSPYPELEEFAKEHADIILEFREGAQYNYMNSKRVFRLDKQITDFVINLPNRDEYKQYKEKALFLQRDIKRIADRFCGSLYSVGRPRRRPLVTGLFGPTKAGKSTILFASIIFLTFRSKRIPKRLKERMLRNIFSEIFCLFPNQDFWNGFNGQSHIVIDEFGALKSDYTVPSNEFMELLRIANIMGYTPDQAEAHKKGEIGIQDTEFVWLTTNQTHFDAKEMVSPEAMTGRIAQPWVVVPKFELCDSSSINGYKAENLWTRRADPEKVAQYIKSGLAGPYGLETRDFIKWNCDPSDVKTAERNTRRLPPGGYATEEKCYTFMEYIQELENAKETLDISSDTFIDIYDQIITDLSDKYELKPEEYIKCPSELPTETYYESWCNIFKQATHQCVLPFNKDITYVMPQGNFDWFERKAVDLASDPVKMAFLKNEFTKFNNAGDLNEHLQVHTQSYKNNLENRMEDRMSRLDRAARKRDDDLLGAEELGLREHIDDGKAVVYRTYEAKKYRVNSDYRTGIHEDWENHAVRLRDTIESFRLKPHYSIALWYTIMKTKAYSYLIYLDYSSFNNKVWQMAKAFIFDDSDLGDRSSVCEMIREFLIRHKTWVAIGTIVATGLIIVPALVSHYSTTLPEKVEQQGNYAQKHSVKAKAKTMNIRDHPDAIARGIRQSANYKNVYDTIDSLNANNVYNLFSVATNSEGAIRQQDHGSITFIVGQTAMLPHHFLDEIATKVEDGFQVSLQLRDPLTLQIRFIVDSEQVKIMNAGVAETGLPKARYEFVWDSERRTNVKKQTSLGTSTVSEDLAFIEFPTYVKPHRNISAKFLPSNYIPDFDNDRIFSCQFRGIYCTLTNSVPFAFNMMTYACGPSDVAYRPSMAIFYEVPSIQGDCGQPVYLFCSRTNQVYIAGMHCAGSGGLAMAMPVTDIVINELLGKIPSSVIVAEQQSCPEILSRLLPPHCNIVGRGQAVHMPDKSKIVPTPLSFELNHLFTPETKPAPLKKRKDFDPLYNGRMRFGKPSIPFPQHIIDNGDRIMRLKYNKFSHKKVENPRIWTYREAVAGIPGRVDGISRSTSSGDQISQLYGSKFKQRMWGKEGSYDFNNPLALAYEEFISNLILRMEGNEWVRFTFIDFNKDETKKSDKTRMFCAGPLALLIIGRMYSLSCNEWLQENRIHNGHLVGLNVYSNEFSMLGAKLETKPYKLALDHSNWDGDMKGQSHEMFRSTQDSYYRGFITECDRRVQNIVLLNNIHSHHLATFPRHELDPQQIEAIEAMPFVDDAKPDLGISEAPLSKQLAVVYEVHNANPSGQCNTTTTNCDVNGKLSYGLTAEIAERELGYINDEEILENVDFNLFGDDNVAGISEKYKFINLGSLFTEFSKYGMTITPDDKTSVAEGLRTLEEVTILCRSFVRVYDFPGILFAAKLNFDSIMEPLFWMPYDRSIADQKLVIQRQLYELSIHEEQIFTVFRDAILVGCKKCYNWTPLIYSYRECRKMFFRLEITY